MMILHLTLDSDRPAMDILAAIQLQGFLGDLRSVDIQANGKVTVGSDALVFDQEGLAIVNNQILTITPAEIVKTEAPDVSEVDRLLPPT